MQHIITTKLNFVLFRKKLYSTNTSQHFTQTLPNINSTTPSQLQYRDNTQREHNWKWNSIQKQKVFFDNIFIQLKLKHWTDWYKISGNKIRKLEGGAAVLQHYSGSLFKALKAVYPLNDWQECEIRTKLPQAFLHTIPNQRKFLESLRKRLNYPRVEDLHQLTNKILKQNGGSGILRKYNGNIISLLNSVYPEVDWDPLYRTHFPRRFWKNKENHRTFLDHVYDQLGLKHWTDWYSVAHTTLLKYKGGGLLNIYGGSLFLALKANYPEKNWNAFNKDRITQGYWLSIENQRDFLERFSQHHQFKSFDDWYKVSQDSIIQFGGASLLSKHSWSLYKVLQVIYPDHPWIITNFPNVKKHKIIDIRSVLLDFQKIFLIRRKEDWYRLSKPLLMANHPFGCTIKNPSLYSTLREAHPDQVWKLFNFNNRIKKSAQRWLCICLESLYPQYMFVEDYLHPLVCFGKSGIPMEFDSFIPSLNLGFEYNGEQHYDDIPSSFSPIEVYKARDVEKTNIAAEMGVTLIEIPFWWDRKVDSLSLILNTFTKNMY